MSKPLFSTVERADNPWASISDIMSGLMVIFLFISVAYMSSVTKAKDRVEQEKIRAEQEKDKVEQIAVTWNKVQDDLFRELLEEFRNDLPKWKASLNRETLAVRFEEPSVFFESGSAALTQGFKSILSNFFPRYINVLRKYQDNIAEVRIEGHTSSEWIGAKSVLDAYFHNMELSQDRTRSVLQYCLSIPSMEKHRAWAVSTITANGLSSSTPRKNEKGEEDPSLSRRVEFRVRTDAERRIMTILGGIK